MPAGLGKCKENARDSLGRQTAENGGEKRGNKKGVEKKFFRSSDWKAEQYLEARSAAVFACSGNKLSFGTESQDVPQPREARRRLCSTHPCLFVGAVGLPEGHWGPPPSCCHPLGSSHRPAPRGAAEGARRKGESLGTLWATD